MAKFYLNGDIVDNGQAWENDVSPQMLKEFIDGLQDNEDIELEITSFGGSCTAGNAMVSMLRGASANGHRTIAHVVSIAASMASVVACACDELIIDSNAFLMVHLPWTTVEGNYEQMRKEADTLELFTKSLVSVYRTKFNLSDDEIISLLQAETWILGEDVETYGLNCSVNKVEGELKVAASCKYGYRNIPRGLVKMEEKTIEEIEKVGDEVLAETVAQDVVVSKDETTNEEQTPAEEPKEDEEVLNKDEVLAKFAEYEKQIGELKQANEELQKELDECQKQKDEAKDTISKDECEKRVSGMQASMQKQINEHLSQLKAKDEEIRTVRAELSSLNSKLEETNRELTEKSSALEEKTNALAMLNAGVNAPSEDLPTMKDGLAKCATPAEKVAFLKAGKFVR